MAKTARGCPRCGSHTTWGLGKSGVQVCDSCDYRWIPCNDPYCRGYRIVMDDPAPVIIGCPECDAQHGGVKADVVRWWAEAWRAVARKLDEREKPPVTTENAIPAKE